MCQQNSAQQNWRVWKKAIAIVGGLLVVFILVVVSPCCFFGIRSTPDLRAYGAMAGEHFHPIWKDLAWRRICKGDSVESLLQRHPPVRREDFGPYTKLSYAERGSFNTLGGVAKNAKLIDARASSCTWQHVFFTAPEEDEAFRQAWTEYVHQRLLEGQAYHIHRTIATGQDIFLSRQVERFQVRDDPNESEYSAEMLEQMRQIYGQAYLDSVMTHWELTVEVTEVLYGDLEPGTVLKFRGDNCEDAGRDGAEAIFLHVKDSRLLWSHSEGGETYTTVPREALDWYQSLTADEVKKLEALRQSGSTATVK